MNSAQTKKTIPVPVTETKQTSEAPPDSGVMRFSSLS
jgi:hypothetical protein